MRLLVVVAFCLANSSLGRRVQIPLGKRQRKLSRAEWEAFGPTEAVAVTRLHKLNAFAMLLKSESAAAFNPSGLAMHSPVRNHGHLIHSQRPGRRIEIGMSDDMRIDTDGGAYTFQEFKDFYGHEAQEKWDAAQPTGIVSGEKRIDPTDGSSYSQKEFQDYYGISWQEKWDAAQPAPSPATEHQLSTIEFKTPQDIPVKVQLEVNFGDQVSVGDVVKCRIKKLDIGVEQIGLSCK
mmetsp:Transcript_99754/g.172001  ORF Transcript_99754/g.172001 Transcript_99754/m.172001 type:complete len:235 (-) Transcript_99754:14-718(-)